MRPRLSSSIAVSSPMPTGTVRNSRVQRTLLPSAFQNTRSAKIFSKLTDPIQFMLSDTPFQSVKAT